VARRQLVAFLAIVGVLATGLLTWAVVSTLLSKNHPGDQGNNVPSASAAAFHSCKEVDGLPDTRCTPGVAYNDVTQGTIASTICKSGYTSTGVRSDGRTVRPPTSFTDALKTSGIAAYSYGDTSSADYEEDHLIPLELGGDGWNPANLWPEPRYGPHPAPEKDEIENRIHLLVCSGKATLVAAQRAISSNWEAALSAATSP